MPEESSVKHGSLWPWFAGLGIATALIAVAVVILVRMGKGPSTGLEYVPGDAAAFVSIRVAEVWKSSRAAETREIFGTYIDKALQEACGLDFADLERVTIVLPKLSEGGNADIWAIVKTAKAYDRERVRAGFAPDMAEKTHNGQTYFTSRAGAVHFLADDLLVFGTPEGVRDFLGREKVTEGPLRQGVALAGSHDVVLAVLDPWRKKSSRGFNVLHWPTSEEMSSAWRAILTVKVADEAPRFDLRIELDGEATAKTVEGLLRMACFEAKPLMKHLPIQDMEVSRTNSSVVISGTERTAGRRGGHDDVIVRGKDFAVIKSIEVEEERLEGRSVKHYHNLMSRRTALGCNFLQPELGGEDFSRLATTYYSRNGPAGLVMEKFNWWPHIRNSWWADARLPASLVALNLSAAHALLPTESLAAAWSEPAYAIVGDPVGTLASYARPYQPLHYFATQPKFLELSLPREGNPPRFHFLRDALDRGVMLEVIPGAPRRKLADSKTDNFFHAMFIDTYRESVEMLHEELLTKQGMELCMQKLAPGGVLCYHISNRYFRLAEVLADVADSLGYHCRRGMDRGPVNAGRSLEHYSSEWVVVARDAEDLKHLVEPVAAVKPPFWGGIKKEVLPFWSSVPVTGKHLWTDESRPFTGLYHKDPVLCIASDGLQSGRFLDYPGVGQSEAAVQLLDHSLTVFQNFLVANRNKGQATED